jgi:hypothetical protein
LNRGGDEGFDHGLQIRHAPQVWQATGRIDLSLGPRGYSR